MAVTEQPPVAKRTKKVAELKQAFPHISDEAIARIMQECDFDVQRAGERLASETTWETKTRKDRPVPRTEQPAGGGKRPGGRGSLVDQILRGEGGAKGRGKGAGGKGKSAQVDTAPRAARGKDEAARGAQPPARPEGPKAAGGALGGRVLMAAPTTFTSAAPGGATWADRARAQQPAAAAAPQPAADELTDHTAEAYSAKADPEAAQEPEEVAAEEPAALPEEARPESPACNGTGGAECASPEDPAADWAPAEQSPEHSSAGSPVGNGICNGHGAAPVCDAVQEAPKPAVELPPEQPPAPAEREAAAAAGRTFADQFDDVSLPSHLRDSALEGPRKFTFCGAPPERQAANEQPARQEDEDGVLLPAHIKHSLGQMDTVKFNFSGGHGAAPGAPPPPPPPGQGAAPQLPAQPPAPAPTAADSAPRTAPREELPKELPSDHGYTRAPPMQRHPSPPRQPPPPQQQELAGTLLGGHTPQPAPRSQQQQQQQQRRQEPPFSRPDPFHFQQSQPQQQQQLQQEQQPALAHDFFAQGYQQPRADLGQPFGGQAPGGQLQQARHRQAQPPRQSLAHMSQQSFGTPNTFGMSYGQSLSGYGAPGYGMGAYQGPMGGNYGGRDAFAGAQRQARPPYQQYHAGSQYNAMADTPFSNQLAQRGMSQQGCGYGYGMPTNYGQPSLPFGS
eukprot:TRINITY_DN1268_c1_g1_i1.p1 TRINITY_DN1268_c1_g1~~TRINITY_DN1268_c1_g1_i1.p1  ORF type:complete len:677 (+),score=231.07 TRINITY_DN1268_c1_g1_i1:146-2176(+)